MASLLPRTAPLVCKSCRVAQLTRAGARPFTVLANAKVRSQPPRPSLRRQAQRTTRGQVRALSSVIVEEAEQTKEQPVARSRKQLENPAAALTAIKRDAATIISGTSLPSNEEIMQILGRAHSLANILVYGDEGTSREDAQDTDVETTARPHSPQQTDTSSALLDDLSEETATQRPSRIVPKSNMSVAFRAKSAEVLCEVIYSLLNDPKVNISSSALHSYTTTQCMLNKPEYLPEIFDLYVNKPLATQTSAHNISFSPRRTWHPHSAIPISLATLALSSAIHKRDMGLAVAITDTTVATRAYRYHRFLTQATPKLSLLTMIPFTAFTISSWASTYQNTFEPEMAQAMALMAATAYIGTFGSIAFVAVTTWSDHHDRVHWQVGKTLSKRWLQEDERMFLDRIAQAWGFEDKKRRGEEQGEEWEALRDTVGLRGMVLDKTEFLEGMQ